MDIVFCGTPEFAVPTLQRLVESSGFDVRLVVTQPDRPRGRGMELAISPVKRYTNESKIPVVQPEAIKSNQDFQRQLTALHPQAIVVVGRPSLIEIVTGAVLMWFPRESLMTAFNLCEPGASVPAVIAMSYGELFDFE